MRKTVYLSLGSNVGNRAAHLKAAIADLAALGKVIKVSSFYETEPVEFTSQPWFLNCVVKLQTEKMPKQLLTSLLGIERRNGRNRSQERSKGPRTIDLDILLFGKAVVRTAELSIPHPAMHHRRFVLEPLAEIAAEVRHPILKQTIGDLLNSLPPGQAARKLAME